MEIILTGLLFSFNLNSTAKLNFNQKRRDIGNKSSKVKVNISIPQRKLCGLGQPIAQGHS